MVKLFMSTDITIESSWEGSTPLKSLSVNVIGGILGWPRSWLDVLPANASSWRCSNYPLKQILQLWCLWPRGSSFSHLLEGRPSSCDVHVVDRLPLLLEECDPFSLTFLPDVGIVSWCQLKAPLSERWGRLGIRLRRLWYTNSYERYTHPCVHQGRLFHHNSPCWTPSTCLAEEPPRRNQWKGGDDRSLPSWLCSAIFGMGFAPSISKVRTLFFGSLSVWGPTAVVKDLQT